MKELTARARRAKEDLKRRDDALSELAYKRSGHPDHAAPADWLWGNPVVRRRLCSWASHQMPSPLLRNPQIAFAGLVPFFRRAGRPAGLVQVDERQEAATYIRT